MTAFVHHTATTPNGYGTADRSTTPACTDPVSAAAPALAASVTAAGPRPADPPTAAEVPDLDLQKAVRRTGRLRSGFYLVVLIVALTGQVTGAVTSLRIPVLFAVPAVAALELGGVVVLANADVRRRLGERATGSRILSAAIAAGAVAFNWLAHPDHLAGGFFASMSLLGYLVWLTHTDNSRRDRLRARGALPPTTPAYEIIGHWLRHPGLTRRAKALARAHPALGLYDSFAAAREQRRLERCRAAISTVLHRKIRAVLDPVTADIAVHVYDLDRIAALLADQADYAALTALIAADLAPTRLAAPAEVPPPRSRRRRLRGEIRHAVQQPDAGVSGSDGIAAGASPTSSDQPPAPDATGRAVVRPANHSPADARQSSGPTAAVDGPLSARSSPGKRTDPSGRSTDGDQLDGLGLSAGKLAGAPDRTAAHTRMPPAGIDPSGITDVAADLTSGRSGGVLQEGGSGGRVRTARGPDSATAEPTDHAPPRQTADAVAYWHRREPDLHPREIAARIGRSERTVRRYWPTRSSTGH